MLVIEKTKAAFLVVGAWLCVAISAWVSAGEGKEFSHADHIEEGAECSDCHNTAADLPELKREACEDCHEDGPLPWKLAARALRLNAKFPHKAHAAALECEKCHKTTAEDGQLSDKSMLLRSSCEACHVKSKVEIGEADCSRCHGVDQRKVPPGDHSESWLRRHGTEAQWRVFETHGSECYACHRKSACLTCHKNSLPRSHTALWRVRTHGVAAAWDSDTCKECHETGTCVRCHRSTAPMNHRGAWSATHGLAAQTKGNQHCAVCHSLARCAACHNGK